MVKITWVKAKFGIVSPAATSMHGHWPFGLSQDIRDIWQSQAELDKYIRACNTVKLGYDIERNPQPWPVLASVRLPGHDVTVSLVLGDDDYSISPLESISVDQLRKLGMQGLCHFRFDFGPNHKPEDLEYIRRFMLPGTEVETLEAP